MLGATKPCQGRHTNLLFIGNPHTSRNHIPWTPNSIPFYLKQLYPPPPPLYLISRDYATYELSLSNHTNDFTHQRIMPIWSSGCVKARNQAIREINENCWISTSKNMILHIDNIMRPIIVFKSKWMLKKTKCKRFIKKIVFLTSHHRNIYNYIFNILKKAIHLLYYITFSKEGNC